jgi:predicted nucleic acid-binding protein
VGVQAETAVLHEVAEGAYQLQAVTNEDMVEAVELVERYRELRLGLADASIAIIRHHRGPSSDDQDPEVGRAPLPLSASAVGKGVRSTAGSRRVTT